MSANTEPRRRLILCFDGTWNALQSHTNVSRLYAEIADESYGVANQRKFYDEGVGTGRFDRLRGGMFGYGLDKNIRAGYGWLASQFKAACQPGEAMSKLPEGTEAKVRDECPKRPVDDERYSNGEPKSAPTQLDDAPFVDGQDIYLFGFSRGAYTARSLGGMVDYLGLPDLSSVSSKESLADHPLVKQAWKLYHERGNATKAYSDQVEAFRKRCRYPVRLHFVGVWDTVGSLGIPNVLDNVELMRLSARYKFHDTSLCKSVRYAYHAMAIDEHRLPYAATLWTKPTAFNEAVEQRWFPGAHSNVGGGYEDDLLPAPPLRWLTERAAECGLAFLNDRRLTQDGKVAASIERAPAAFDLDGREHLSPVRDSYAEFMGGAYRAVRSIPGVGGRVYRRMLVQADGVNQTIDDTAFAKWRADPDYRPPNLGQAGRTNVSFRAAHDAADAQPEGTP